MGQAPQDRVAAHTVVARTLEAQSLVIRDPSGRIRALLKPDPGGPIALTLVDRTGRERLTLGLGPTGGVGVVFRGKAGAVRAALGVEPTGKPYQVPAPPSRSVAPQTR